MVRKEYTSYLRNFRRYVFERFLKTKVERMCDNFLFSLLQMGAPRMNYMYNTEKQYTINLLRNISRNKARTFRGERSPLPAADIRQRKSWCTLIIRANLWMFYTRERLNMLSSIIFGRRLSRRPIINNEWVIKFKWLYEICAESND